jgi:hypothetical protein
VDENEPIVPSQQVMDSMDDYGDPNWEPKQVDAGPGSCFICLFLTAHPPFFSRTTAFYSFDHILSSTPHFVMPIVSLFLFSLRPQNSEQTNQAT